jgi:hypothetical protein
MRREMRNCSSPSKRKALETLGKIGDWTCQNNGPVPVFRHTIKRWSEVYLRPEAEHERRLGKVQGGRDHLQVPGDVAPGRHTDVVEELHAALVADGHDRSDVILEGVAKPQVVIRDAKSIQFAVGERAAPADADDGGGGPPERSTMEAAGIEPASRGTSVPASTCVADLFVEFCTRVRLPLPRSAGSWIGYRTGV